MFQYFKQMQTLHRLIYINILCFVGILILDIVDDTILKISISQYLFPTASFKHILCYPWTVVLYMFSHREISHILFNMLALYFAGGIFIQYFSQKKMASNYILGGICGLCMYIMIYNFVPDYREHINTRIIGASASVMAIFIAVATYSPNTYVHLFIYKIRLKYIAYIYILLDLIAIRDGKNIGGHFSHLGGALWGMFFAIQTKRGRDVSLFFESFIDVVFTFFRKMYFSILKKKRATSMNNYTHIRKQQKVSKDDYSYNYYKIEKKKLIDMILDKISKKGYDSLTKEEREILSDSNT